MGSKYLVSSLVPAGGQGAVLGDGVPVCWFGHGFVPLVKALGMVLAG